MDRLRPRSLLAGVILVTITVATYAGARYGTFQYDDLYTILINPHLDRWETFVRHLDHMVRPLLYATFLVDRSLYGNSPTGYHLLNLLLASAWVLLALGLFQTWRSPRFAAADVGGKSMSSKYAFLLGASLGLGAILLHSFVDFNMQIPPMPSSW